MTGLEVDGFGVDVAAEDAHLEWLVEFYGAGAPVPVREPSALVRLVFDPPRLAARRAESEAAEPRPGFTFEGQAGWMPRWTLGSALVAYDPELDVAYEVRDRSIEIVGGEDVGQGRVALMRAVRDLHERWLLAGGFVLLHAAAVALDDRIVVIAGDRRSGKTTLLTYLLAHGGATFVSNDRTAVDGTGRTVGIPTMVSVRPATFRLVPGLPAIPWGRGTRPRRAMAELQPGSDADGGDRTTPTALSPAQLHTWLGAARSTGGRAVAVMFPEVGSAGAARLEPLGASAVAARLRGARLHPDRDGLVAGLLPSIAAPPNGDPLTGYRCRLGAYPEANARELLREAIGNA